MSDPTERRRPDLTVARRYLSGNTAPVASQEPDGSASPNWLPLYAWPAAILLAVLAIVSWAVRMDAATPSTLMPDPISKIYAMHDYMQYLQLRTLLLALFSVGLIVLNLAAAMRDHARPLAMRLADACSIVIPLLILLSLLSQEVPLGVQFQP
jgi:hypothetical protein